MTDEYDECERCSRPTPDDVFVTIDLINEWRVCEGCAEVLEERVEYHDWRERYTKEQHERAVDLLSEQDEIECVIENYELGQIVVHTPYVSSDVVADFCQQFGLNIASYGPVWREEEEWPCMDYHDSMFQVVLDYGVRSDMPIPMSIEFQKSYIEDLDENDKQF